MPQAPPFSIVDTLSAWLMYIICLVLPWRERQAQRQSDEEKKQPCLVVVQKHHGCWSTGANFGWSSHWAQYLINSSIQIFCTPGPNQAFVGKGMSYPFQNLNALECPSLAGWGDIPPFCCNPHRILQKREGLNFMVPSYRCKKTKKKKYLVLSTSPPG